MKINLHNSSNHPLVTVAKIALPFNYPIENPAIKFQDGTILPLKYLKSVGDISKIFTVKHQFPSGASQAGLVSQSFDMNSPFQLSAWVLKDPWGSIPKFIVTLEDNTEIRLWDGKIEELPGNDHCKTFEATTNVVQGFMVKQFLSVYDGLDHVEFKIALNWHDRFDPTYGKNIKAIRMECSDEFVLHFQNNMGLPRASYLPHIDTWRLDLIPKALDPITNKTQFCDGQGFEIRGYILTAPENLMSTIDDEVGRRLQNLKAVREGNPNLGGVGEVVGVFEDMNHGKNWFRGHLAKNLNPVGGFENLFWEPSLFGLRSKGSTKNPAQTGGQEDFGADKGLEATVLGRADWITYIKGAITSRFRWYNIHEPNSTRVYANNHPGRKTWNMVTFHPHSSDLLGKERNVQRPIGTQWNAFDNQHRSLNNELTYLALTGDELVLDTLRNMLQADYAQTTYELADREVGRMFDFWCKAARVLPTYEAAALRIFIKSKIGELWNNFRGRFWTDESRDVNCVQVIVDPRSGIVNPATGKVEPSWIPFQYAQMIVGVYSILELMDDPSDVIPDMLRRLSNTFLKYGFFKQGNVWYPVMFCRYRTGLESGQNVKKNEMAPEEGLPLPPESFRLGSWEVQVDSVYSQSWWDWVSPAISIAMDHTSKLELFDKGAEILNYAYPNGVKTINSACWFANSLDKV